MSALQVLFVACAVVAITTHATHLARGDEARASAEMILAGSLEQSAEHMRREFAARDHAVLLGRKRAVDWSMAPALLLSEIRRGLPPEAWCAALDDGYGCAQLLEGRATPMPAEVARWCASLNERKGALEFSYSAQVVVGTSSEVPAAIHWSGVSSRSANSLSADWYEPCLAMRGFDYPLPPDRTTISWDDRFMRISVLGMSEPWEQAWPTEGPSFAHIADEYDPFAALRTWHWAHHRDPSQRASVVLSTESPSTPRSLEWRRSLDGRWTLEIRLRESMTPRSAGYSLATGDAWEDHSQPASRTLAIETAVATVPPETTLMIGFKAPSSRERGGDFPGVLQMELRVAGELIAWAHFESVRTVERAEVRIDSQPPEGHAWTHAMMKIRAAQESPSPPPPFPESVIARAHGGAARRAVLCANAWIFAMEGDTAALSGTLSACEALRAKDGMSSHDLAALETFAESLNAAGAPADSVRFVVDRHRQVARRLDYGQLRTGCLAATGAGRFWAAAHCGEVACAHAETPEDLLSWTQIVGRLSLLREDPSAEVSPESDPAVVALSEALNRARVHNGPHTFVPSTRPDSKPTTSAHGRAAPRAWDAISQLIPRV
ncbi:MAG: hypothetical protein EXS03_06005 [Phycisphaerales bacterium]|nr:hypothetical protein [Phycisphaerales bacterium]